MSMTHNGINITDRDIANLEADLIEARETVAALEAAIRACRKVRERDLPCTCIARAAGMEHSDLHTATCRKVRERDHFAQPPVRTPKVSHILPEDF